MPPTLRYSPLTCQGYQEPLLKVGETSLQMILIPGGTFIMGSPEDELDRSESEGPQRKVVVPSFFMGRYPITQAQYEAVMEVNPSTKYDAEQFVSPDKPVIGVSWHDAVAFCDRLAQQTDRHYRLPSEAEWEYACRATTTTPFYFGHTLSDEVANYVASATYADGPEGEAYNATTPIDYFRIANAFGLSDMHGNVLEWCYDHWRPDYEEAPPDSCAWLSSDASEPRILRGGSWSYGPDDCRSASRDHDDPESCYDNVSFRVCCSAQ